MKKQPKKKTGFTLLEMVVVVIIVGILASVAVVYYLGALERVRMTEVVTLIGTEISSQQRRYLTVHRYTKQWHMLDAQPSYVRLPKADNEYANGEENTIFYTRGKDGDGNPRNGFAVYFEQIGAEWFMTADRNDSGDKYDYTLVRPFNDTTTYCIPKEGNERSEVLCSDFMGVDDASLLPEDPRTAYQEQQQNTGNQTKPNPNDKQKQQPISAPKEAREQETKVSKP